MIDDTAHQFSSEKKKKNTQAHLLYAMRIHPATTRSILASKRITRPIPIFSAMRNIQLLRATLQFAKRNTHQLPPF